MKAVFYFLFFLAVFSCKATNLKSSDAASDSHLHGHSHDYSDKIHHHSEGGVLLGGYPWGVFDLQMQFEKRLGHTKNNQEMTLSNRIFEALGSHDPGSAMVAFPVFLEHKGYNPFGDGQSNGHADFSSWSFDSPPYIAIYTGSDGKGQLVVLLHQGLSVSSSDVFDWILDNGPSKSIAPTDLGSDFPDPIKRNYNKMIAVDVEATNWEKRTGGSYGFFKPSSWDDWFAVHFQNPYVPIAELVSSVPKNYREFSVNGRVLSVPNPMKGKAGISKPPLIWFMENYIKDDYLVFPTDKVHSLYPSPGLPETVEKTVGGNWTFLLNPNFWDSGNPPDTFKQLYSCFPGRAYWEESMKKAISGTSWHHVGDPGEFLLNSIEGEERSLVTALGVEVPMNKIPGGGALAFGLSYVGYSGVLKPNFAFISVKGQFHWHPVHTSSPVCIEVWRPFCDVTSSNSYGMACES